MAARVHLFPFRTQKLSSFASKILGGQLPGKIDRCRHNKTQQEHSCWVSIFLRSSVGSSTWLLIMVSLVQVQSGEPMRTVLWTVLFCVFVKSFDFRRNSSAQARNARKPRRANNFYFAILPKSILYSIPTGLSMHPISPLVFLGAIFCAKKSGFLIKNLFPKVFPLLTNIIFML